MMTVLLRKAVMAKQCHLSNTEEITMEFFMAAEGSEVSLPSHIKAGSESLGGSATPLLAKQLTQQSEALSKGQICPDIAKKEAIVEVGASASLKRSYALPRQHEPQAKMTMALAPVHGFAPNQDARWQKSHSSVRQEATCPTLK